MLQKVAKLCFYRGSKGIRVSKKKNTEKKKEELGLLETRASPIGIGGY